MKLETDIKNIEQLSQQREDANWKFRCFLKRSDLSVAKIDSTVKGLYQEISAQIDCTECGNCCKVVQPVLTEADIKKLARHHELSTTEFRSRFLLENEEDEGFVFNMQPCPFLENNRCTVYENRPGVCRSYPHLHKRDFVSRLNQAFFNCSICPIVFNVYEELKRTLGPRWLK
jgi:uncharacterized protein